MFSLWLLEQRHLAKTQMAFISGTAGSSLEQNDSECQVEAFGPVENGMLLKVLEVSCGTIYNLIGYCSRAVQ